jgi:hypothetical protein
MVLDVSAAPSGRVGGSDDASEDNNEDDDDDDDDDDEEDDEEEEEEDDEDEDATSDSADADELVLDFSNKARARGFSRLHISHLLQMVLQDAQTRLFFKAQSVIQSEIRYFTPKSSDLAYPEILLGMNSFSFICSFLTTVAYGHLLILSALTMRLQREGVRISRMGSRKRKAIVKYSRVIRRSMCKIRGTRR